MRSGLTGCSSETMCSAGWGQLADCRSLGGPGCGGNSQPADQDRASGNVPEGEADA